MSRPLVRSALAAGAVGLTGLAAGMIAPPAGAAPTVPVFASGTTSGCNAAKAASPTCYFHPDSITSNATSVFVGYQNNAAADGTSGSSLVVQYSKAGAKQKTFPVPGKNDGLRVDPATGNLWALSNEDANPHLTIITPATGKEQGYDLPTETKFSGGYDDVAFTPNGTFLSASNPALNKSGTTNTYRTVVKAHFAGGKVVLDPVLPGQFQATNRATGKQEKVTLTDPDSLNIDPKTGDIILDGQADSTLVFLHNAGTGDQQVSFVRLMNGSSTTNRPQVDETNTPTKAGGKLLIVDHGANKVYSWSGYTAGTTYSSVTNESPSLTSQLAKTDTHTGKLVTALKGFSDPRGLLVLS